MFNSTRDFYCNGKIHGITKIYNLFDYFNNYLNLGNHQLYSTTFFYQHAISINYSPHACNLMESIMENMRVSETFVNKIILWRTLFKKQI